MADEKPPVFVTPEIQEMITAHYLLETEIASNDKLWKDKKTQERELRQKIIACLWPATHYEGTQRIELGSKWHLKGNVKIDRKVDEALVVPVEHELMQASVSITGLFPRKPTLSLSAYRGLTAEQQLIAKKAFTETPSSPTIEYEAPKEKK